MVIGTEYSCDAVQIYDVFFLKGSYALQIHSRINKGVCMCIWIFLVFEYTSNDYWIPITIELWSNRYLDSKRTVFIGTLRMNISLKLSSSLTCAQVLLIQHHVGLVLKSQNSDAHTLNKNSISLMRNLSSINEQSLVYLVVN